MKRIFALCLALLLFIAIPCEAFAELPDFAAMSDEELQELVNAARNELARRGLAAEEGTVIYDEDGIQIYLTGKQYVEDYGDSSTLYVEVVIINDSDKDIGIMMESSTINGWEIYGWGTDDISAGKKKKAEFEFNASDADVFAIEEVEDIEMQMNIYDSETYETIKKLDPITINFGQ